MEYDVKNTFTYSSSSSDSSLGRAWSSSTCSASCFLLRVDIVLDGMVGVMDERETTERGWTGGELWADVRWGPGERHLGPSHLAGQSKGTLAS